jgi:hypothetical protein
MKHTKLSVILLAFLLAAMAIVPVVSAGGCQDNSAVTSGNAGVIHPGESINLFDEFGLRKPAEQDTNVPFRTYAESKESADRILSALEIPEGSGSVIGTYDLGNYQIMLIGREDSILQAVYDGKTVRTSALVPRLLGEKKESGTPEKIVTDSTVGSDYTITTETATRLYSVTLQLPDEDLARFSPGAVLTTYIVKKSRTDVYRSGLVDIASLHTEGWFYVNYGSSITSIGDYSTYWVTSLPFWQACEYSTQNLGIGSTSAQHKTHLKFGAPYVRDTMDMWVSCDAWLNTNDGGFTNSWSSGNGDACS